MQSGRIWRNGGSCRALWFPFWPQMQGVALKMGGRCTYTFAASSNSCGHLFLHKFSGATISTRFKWIHYIGYILSGILNIWKLGEIKGSFVFLSHQSAIIALSSLVWHWLIHLRVIPCQIRMKILDPLRAVSFVLSYFNHNRSPVMHFKHIVKFGANFW